MKHTYRVTGTTAFNGHQPGSEFAAELDENQERRAVARGSIRRVNKTKAAGADAKSGTTQEAENG